MLTKMQVGAAIVSVVVVAGGAWFLTRPEPAAQTRPFASERKQGDITLPSTGEGEIINYSQSALEHSITKHNVLFFYAGWCNICVAVDRNLEAAAIPNNLTILKVDYDSPEGQSLAKRYNIPTQHVMVQVNTDGTEVTQWTTNYHDSVAEISEHVK